MGISQIVSRHLFIESNCRCTPAMAIFPPSQWLFMCGSRTGRRQKLIERTGQLNGRQLYATNERFSPAKDKSNLCTFRIANCGRKMSHSMLRIYRSIRVDTIKRRKVLFGWIKLNKYGYLMLLNLGSIRVIDLTCQFYKLECCQMYF